jgi:Zn-dependent peptidase ImmA (M78 family)
VSRRFSPEIRRFTIAHELGHALLHSSSGLHRDRAVDGATGSAPRPSREAEADLFASYFLLPEKPLRGAFEQMFLTQRFVLTEERAFALTSKTLDYVQRRCRTTRDVARMLASAEHYNGVHFDSLARRFGVSIEATAIRLEELGLV